MAFIRVAALTFHALEPGDDRRLYYSELCEEFVELEQLSALDLDGAPCREGFWKIEWCTALRLGSGWRDTLIFLGP